MSENVVNMCVDLYIAMTNFFFFDRLLLWQNRGSHITPIGAYHVGRDLVLLMDVSRFGYRSFWIPLTLLWEAMTSSDKATGNSTGYEMMLFTNKLLLNIMTNVSYIFCI